MKKQQRIYLFSALTVALGILVDLLTKALAVERLKGQDSAVLIRGWLRFTYLENDGAAFGSLSEHRWVFMVLSSIGILALCVYLVFVKHNGYLLPISLSLIISGGIGNMIDRVRLGYVVDFIDFYRFDFWRYIFNVADALVCVGAALTVLAVIFEWRAESRKKEEENVNDDLQNHSK
ncbi:MAG: signal peptidase II [Clostridia bacterium]|nr:signal peptidase II [Clostridia bacterium]